MSNRRPSKFLVAWTDSLHTFHDVLDVVQGEYHAAKVACSHGWVVLGLQTSRYLIALVKGKVVIIQKTVPKGTIRDRGSGARRNGDSRDC